jgi:hypothetical protein
MPMELANFLSVKNRQPPMSLAEKQALALRDLAVMVAKAKGVISGPDVHSYADSRIRIEYDVSGPHVLDVFKHSDSNSKVLSVVWQDAGDAVVVLHRTGHGKIR